jgi:cardiolipin synthase
MPSWRSLTARSGKPVSLPPYFVPDLPLLAAIQSCARRGVEITLILPARNDSAVVAAITSAHYVELLAAHVTLREYHGGLLHAKTLVVDRSVTLVGSANMDFRSLYMNFENNIRLYSDDVSRAVAKDKKRFIVGSTPISLEEVQSQSKARAAFDNLLTNVWLVF